MSVTENALLDGRVRLRQSRDGYRVGMDAILLAAACEARPGARVLDAGCGVGAVMLSAAALNPDLSFLGVERDPEAASLARENIALNGVAARVGVIVGEVGGAFAGLRLPPFDAVLANPPYFEEPGALRGPAPTKRDAWLNLEGLEAWVRFLITAVREGGTITLIHRADRLADLLFALAPKAGSVQIRPIASFADAPAKRVILRAVRTGKAPLSLLPPLVLHEREGGAKHRPEAEAILRGAARLAWR